MIMLSPARASTSTSTDGATLDFRWIEDDGLLRDEGVLFGLARDEGGLKAKEECIRAYYLFCRAETARVRAGLEAELARCESREAALPRPPASVEPAFPGDGAPAALAVRYGLGILASAAACVGTGALVYDQLRSAFGPAALVTLGVVAAGFFTAFLPVSLLFVADGAERPGRVELWKIRLAEFGVPLVAAVFVAVWAWERLGGVRAVSTAALLFLVFVFAGRQLLSSVPRLGEAIRTMRAQRGARAVDLRHQAEARTDELRRAIASLRSDAEWDAIRDAKVALFRSEFGLAGGSGQHPARFVSPSAVISSNGSR
ncbi:MAG TPA: hypothetical protein VLK66_03035 [Longimicrobium sp.]|nr:hypothetical protein [Longimicrobium sp.]